MKILNNKWLYIGIGIVLVLLLIRKCEDEPKVITKTKVVYKERTDTITNTIIKEVPKKVYYEVVKTVKGKDSIVYVDKPSDNSQTAQVWDVEVKTDSSKANLKITSLTKPIDVRGTIECLTKETTITNTIIKPKSGLFLSVESSVNPLLENIGVGLDYQFKNTVMIGAGVNYDNRINQTYVSARVGIRIF